MSTAGDFSAGLSNLGGAVSDIFGSQGAAASAKSYSEAQFIAQQNAQIAQNVTNTQELQLKRNLYQTLGTQRAQVGGAGFAESGSALDILRASKEQGAITQATTAEQGAITSNSYNEQAGLFGGMSAAAQATSTAGQIGGVLQLAGGAVNIANGVNLLTSGSGTAAGTAAAVGAGGAILDAGITAAGSAGGADMLSTIASFAAFA